MINVNQRRAFRKISLKYINAKYTSRSTLAQERFKERREKGKETREKKLRKIHCKSGVLSLNPKFPADTFTWCEVDAEVVTFRIVFFLFFFFYTFDAVEYLTTINLRAQSTLSFLSFLSPSLSLSISLSFRPFLLELVDRRKTHSIPRTLRAADR